jgi:hypothetical protein
MAVTGISVAINCFLHAQCQYTIASKRLNTSHVENRDRRKGPLPPHDSTQDAVHHHSELRSQDKISQDRFVGRDLRDGSATEIGQASLAEMISWSREVEGGE